MELGIDIVLVVRYTTYCKRETKVKLKIRDKL